MKRLVKTLLRGWECRVACGDAGTAKISRILEGAGQVLIWQVWGRSGQKISTRAELCNGQNPSDRDTSKHEQRGVGTDIYQDVPQKK